MAISPSTISESKPPLKFEFKEKARSANMSGGLFYVLLNGRKLCDYRHWAFASCGVGTLSHFGGYYYAEPEGRGKFPRLGSSADMTNVELLELYHEDLFKWLETTAPDQWTPKEFYMVLSTIQRNQFPKMLAHPCVRLIDHFLNKSHGPNNLYLYRISLKKDFPK